MMTLVHNHMPVIRHEVGDFALPDEALDQGDIDHTRRLPLSATDNADLSGFDIDEGT